MPLNSRHVRQRSKSSTNLQENNHDWVFGHYRQFVRGVGRGDVPTVLAAFAPNINWTEAEGFPYGGTYVGPDAVLQNVFAKLGSEWNGYTAVPHELIASGDTVVALGEYSGTYKATGKSFKAPFAHVWKFGASQIISFRQHTDTVVVQRALQSGPA